MNEEKIECSTRQTNVTTKNDQSYYNDSSELERDDEINTFPLSKSKASTTRSPSTGLGMNFKNIVQSSVVKTGLCQLITYRNDDQSDFHGVNAVNSHMKLLWSNRGATLSDKMNLPLMFCVGAQGQGKTELCRQLVLQKTVDLEDVDEFICIHISFNQITTYDHECEAKIPTFQKFVWRVMYALTNDKDWLYNGTNLIQLHELLDLIRNNISSKIDKSRIAVLFAVDEIMKIEQDDVRGNMLDILGTLQQNQLYHSLPTFVLVTSLYHHQVTNHITIKSRRPIQHIILPFLTDQSLNDITNMIVKDLIKAITGSDENSSEYKNLYFSHELHRTIRIALSISGMRFRDLEFILKSLYSKFVHKDNHERAKKLKLSVLSLNEYKPSDSLFIETKSADNIKLYSDLRNSLLVPTISYKWSYNDDYYQKILEIFLELILDPNTPIYEDYTIQKLQDKGIIVVKGRIKNEFDLDQFIPRINLGSIHKYALATAENRNEQQYKTLRGPFTKKIESILSYTKCFLFSDQPRHLMDHTTMLLNNIIAAVYSSSLDLPSNFEDLMAWVELLRIISYRKKYGHKLLSLDEILPGVIFSPWESESIHVSSWITKNKFFPSIEINLTLSERKDPNSLVETRKMIDESASTNPYRIITSQPSDRNSYLIEYVASHFSAYYNNNCDIDFQDDINSNETQVKLLCLMKLSIPQDKNPISILNNIHKLASDCDLPRGSYYAVLYCCYSKDNIDNSNLPPGSIIVCKETLLEVFRPFGASSFLNLLEVK